MSLTPFTSLTSLRKRASATFLLISLVGLLGLAFPACVPQESASRQRTPIRVPTSTSLRTPTPGPLPTTCPLSHPDARVVFSKLAPVIGTTPVWATWSSGENKFHLIPPSPYPSTYEAPYGWQMTKVIWEVGPQYAGHVTLRGYERSDNTPLLFQFDGDVPVATAILDPQHPSHPVSALGADWAEWGSYIVVPKAGCYTIEVSWTVGHWDVTFAAGA